MAYYREINTVKLDQLPSFSIMDAKKLRLITSIPGNRQANIVLKIKSTISAINMYFSINFDTDRLSPYCCIKFSESGYTQKIPLIKVKSNLPANNGYQYFFICQHTGKRCKKLHLANDSFIHRTAIQNRIYTIQSLGYKMRNEIAMMTKYRKSLDVVASKSAPNFFRSYAGIVTKREKAVQEAKEYIDIVNQICHA